MMTDDVDWLRSQVSALQQLLDVHERTALDQAQRLEAERALMREFFQQAPAAVSLVRGPDFVIEFVNHAFLQLVSGRSDVVGKTLAEAFPELGPQGFLEMLERVYATGEPFVATELPVIFDRRGDGTLEEAFFNVAWQPMRDAAGEVYGIISQGVEVTEIVRARRRSEALAEDLRGLADAAVEINSALSVQTILEVVVARARSIVGTHRAAAFLSASEDGEAAAAVSQDEGRYGPHPRTGGDIGAQLRDIVMQMNRPLRLATMDIQARAGGASPELLNWLGAPFVDRDGTNAGVLVFADKVSGEFNESDEAIAVQLALMASGALRNARVFEREHQAAELLQRSLLPQSIPDLPGIAIATRYLPGGTAHQVGGDWFDVIPLLDGRVGFTLGDVGGRGIRAASIMGQLRMSVRAYALDGDSPGSILARTDRLLHTLGEDQMATMLYALWDPETNDVRIASAGHLPPVMIEPSGAARLLDIPAGVPLGVLPSAVFDERTLRLERGASLLLYSDGLVEERGQSLDVGLQRLLDAAGGAARDPEGLCEHLLATMLPAPKPPDDVAVLVLRTEGAPDGPMRLRLPAEPAAVSHVRRALAHQLRDLASPEDLFDLSVAVSEACANAVEHAYGPQGGALEVESTVQAGTVHVVVRDFGSWREPRESDRGRGIGIIEAMTDAAEVRTGPDGTVVEMRRALSRAGVEVER